MLRPARLWPCCYRLARGVGSNHLHELCSQFSSRTAAGHIKKSGGGRPVSVSGSAGGFADRGAMRIRVAVSAPDSRLSEARPPPLLMVSRYRLVPAATFVTQGNSELSALAACRTCK